MSAGGKTRLGLRAITMQQPFAAAMAHGRGLYTRRGRPTQFHDGQVAGGSGSGRKGEWVAVHCGRNKVHVNNKRLMENIRKAWPSCPSDRELLDSQVGYASLRCRTPRCL